VTLAGSNIDSSKFYFCEKHANLHRFSYMLAISWQKQMAKFGLRKVKKGSRYFFYNLCLRYIAKPAGNPGEEHGMAQQSSVQTITHNLLAAINSKLMNAHARCTLLYFIADYYKTDRDGSYVLAHTSCSYKARSSFNNSCCARRYTHKT